MRRLFTRRAGSRRLDADRRRSLTRQLVRIEDRLPIRRAPGISARPPDPNDPDAPPDEAQLVYLAYRRAGYRIEDLLPIRRAPGISARPPDPDDPEAPLGEAHLMYCAYRWADYLGDAERSYRLEPIWLRKARFHAERLWSQAVAGLKDRRDARRR